MTELSRLLKVDDNEGVIDLIPQIRSLDIEVPDSLYFLEARALERTGNALASRDRLVVYLANAGRDGRYYDQATQLLLKVRDAAEAQEAAQQEAERQRRMELAKTAEKARSMKIREAQRLLYQVGYPATKETGELDKTTRISLATYQIMKDLPVNGDITDEAYAMLQESVPESHACDEHAAYPQRPIEWGISISAMDEKSATTLCNEALRVYPDAIRFHIQYARALYASGRASDALAAVQKAADLGYPAAETLIGRMYLDGSLDERERPDEEAALEWFQKAAEEAYPDALIAIGRMHEAGDGGLRRDADAAVESYKKAADQGHPPAQVLLGMRYHEGLGVRRNYQTAFEYYTKAAESGYAMGEFMVGMAYERGRGVKRNRDSAKAWFRQAADKGHNGAKERLKRLGG